MPTPVWLGILVAIVIASLLNAVVAALTHSAGASTEFAPLTPQAFIPLTTIGILLATAGWALLRRSRHPEATLRWIVPAVLAISFAPDILLGVTQSKTGTSWTAIAGLMTMHVVVAVVVVAMLVRTLPVSDPEYTSTNN